MHNTLATTAGLQQRMLHLLSPISQLPTAIIIFFSFSFYTRYYPKFGPGKATEATRAVLPSPTSACWVFSCFRNPLNSDMDYRIFNVIILMCIYTQGLGTQTSQHNILTQKNCLSCAPNGVQTSGLRISSPANSATPSCGKIKPFNLVEVIVLHEWSSSSATITGYQQLAVLNRMEPDLPASVHTRALDTPNFLMHIALD